MEKRENKEVQPSTRRRLQGIVVSDKIQKTIVVETENYIKYPVYKKRVSIRKKYKVDDKKEIARVGDLVIIEECLPLSQDKRFRLVQIIKKGESKWLKQKNLVVADNSGARAVRAFRLIGDSFRKSSAVGDIVICTAKDEIPKWKVKKGDIVKGVIVKTKKEYQRNDGSTLKFDNNAVVLINEDGSPKGKRVFGPVARELREKGDRYMKIVCFVVEVL